MSQEINRSSVLVNNLRDIFTSGRTRPVKFREKQLKNFLNFLRENEEAVVQAIAEDVRKPLEEARTELIIGINHIVYLINNFKKWVAPEKVQKRFIDLFDGVYLYKDPYGVVLVMGAWNVPLLTLLPVAGAIAAGNCVVVKPSHNSPTLGELLAKTLPAYLDIECYPIFLGDVPETSQLLEEQFDYIYYTGSTHVGKIVHLAANKHLTPVTLELGGKNPVYIDASADLQLTATRVLWGKCTNSGQACIAPDYILCTKEVQDRFVAFAEDALKQFYKKDKDRFLTIFNDAHFKRLSTMMKGLDVVLGGRTDSMASSIEPTIVVNVERNQTIMQEEIFGPILPIITVKDVQEAVTFINERDKPLALYIFTKNQSVSTYILNNTSCGGVTVNDTLMHLLVESLPFGGVGASGMGSYKGRQSVDTFLHKKSVLVKNFSSVLEWIQTMRYPPYTKKKSDIMRTLLQSRKGIPLSGLMYISTFLIGVVIGCIIYHYFS